MPTDAARSPLTPGHRRRAIALGAVFVGSSLIAVMSPAYAEPSPSGTPSGSAPPPTSSASPAPSPSPSPTESPTPSPEPPVVSAVIDFGRGSDEVALGERTPANPLTVTNNGDASICLVRLTVNTPGFGVRDFTPQEVAPEGSASAGEVTGAARETTDVVATLTYALAQEGVDCAALEPADRHNVSTGTWTVSVVGPDPSPSPDPTPSPTKEPSPSPTDGPDGNGGDEGNEEDEDETSPPDEASDPDTSGTGGDQTGDSGGSGDSGSSGGSGGSGDSGGSGGSGNSGGSGGGVDDVPTSDVPTSDDTSGLPSDEADLPGVVPGAENLAELPTVTPGSPEDDGVDETEVAANHGDLGPNMAPAVLLAAFLLALLLATPLAPARRVRVGGGYQGRRRKR
ncbi:hypothetical protein [Nocardiopsis halotolerans]|uniref:hypothetical protein n=1 Tax=Nocardiopsis halotolerans TaxID=124252 RepID=UPI00034A3570|nr:hypothetical protein [Nocardiopsis halotolerans]